MVEGKQVEKTFADAEAILAGVTDVLVGGKGVRKEGRVLYLLMRVSYQKFVTETIM